ncbi:hypothetical protein [Arcanobacterium hippocoleae]|uniref:hypothetical protein n=1 Tax=Arcanobacterium hippocoleae TaxID=149017 RepID=UPI0033424FB8
MKEFFKQFFSANSDSFYTFLHPYRAKILILQEKSIFLANSAIICAGGARRKIIAAADANFPQLRIYVISLHKSCTIAKPTDAADRIKCRQTTASQKFHAILAN